VARMVPGESLTGPAGHRSGAIGRLMPHAAAGACSPQAGARCPPGRSAGRTAGDRTLLDLIAPAGRRCGMAITRTPTQSTTTACTPSGPVAVRSKSRPALHPAVLALAARFLRTAEKGRGGLIVACCPGGGIRSKRGKVALGTGQRRGVKNFTSCLPSGRPGPFRR
jgi:hypothetical protein